MQTLPKIIRISCVALPMMLAGVNTAFANTVVYADSSIANTGGAHCADRGLHMNCSLEYLRKVCIDLGFEDTSNRPSQTDDPATDRHAPKGPSGTIAIACR